MASRSTPFLSCRRRAAFWLATGATAWLAGCGGGSPEPGTPESNDARVASGTTTLAVGPAMLPADTGAQVVRPSFHVAPVLLDEPDHGDADGRSASAGRGPHLQSVPDAQAGLDTRGLTLQRLEASRRARALAAGGVAAGGASPLAGSTTVAAYTPAQIRAAYGLPGLPAPGSSLSAAQKAALGAGQTIYIVDALHDPNVAAELAAFNQRFGLPACTRKSLAPNAPLPLADPSAASCDLVVAYVDARGAITSTAPSYDEGWATEIALDVQWAHATAPLARIVLIEAPDASVNSLLGAVRLANAMGPGVVSMSFGSNEGNWTESADAAFSGAGMSYLAATGDSGAGVSWPSVSARVLAVGGTTLSWGGSGTAREETAWSGTGGGTSAFVATPAYQTAAVPGLGTQARRTVADVAFNADPATGQYTAVMPRAGGDARWLSVGGTSLATPQWAGLLAVANALRAASARPVLAAPHEALYAQVSAYAGADAGAFLDIVQGVHGPCGTCSAGPGYDPLTGLGTPRVSALLSQLTGVQAPPPASTAPSVSAATVTGQAGTALSYAMGVSAQHPVSFSLRDAPAGMAISAAGVVSWAAPVAGSWNVTVTATDTATGQTGTGVLGVTIASVGPSLTTSPLQGKSGKALTATFAISAPGATSVSVAVRGAPPGMKISLSKLKLTLSWPKPVVGSYKLELQVADNAGRTAFATVPVTITAK